MVPFSWISGYVRRFVKFWSRILYLPNSQQKKETVKKQYIKSGLFNVYRYESL